MYSSSIFKCKVDFLEIFRGCGCCGSAAGLLVLDTFVVTPAAAVVATDPVGCDFLRPLVLGLAKLFILLKLESLLELEPNPEPGAVTSANPADAALLLLLPPCLGVRWELVLGTGGLPARFTALLLPTFTSVESDLLTTAPEAGPTNLVFAAGLEPLSAVEAARALM